MSEPKLLTRLVALSKIDASLALIAGERKKLENELKEKTSHLSLKEKDAQTKRHVLEDRKRRHQKDEKVLNEERAKIVDRRKALASFNQPKIQQAAEREISAAADALNAQEEGLITMLQELENEEKSVKSLEEAVLSLKAECEKFSAEVSATFVTLEDRQRDKESARAEVAKTIDATSINTYAKVKEKFPQNVVVAVAKNNCSGCYMNLVPQVLVQIARGESIIRCPGCARILCLEEHLASQAG